MKNEIIETKLPAVPFSIYFMEHGEIIPKKWFTVTECRPDTNELYVAELKQWETFNRRLIKVVGGFFPN